jgi:predicted nucleic acid-binding protein
MATTLVDSNVLLDVFTQDDEWGAWSADVLAEAARGGPLVINPMIYAEVSRPLRSHRGTGRGAAAGLLPAVADAVRSGVSGGAVFHVVPPPRRRPPIADARLLHRRACGPRRVHAADP